LGISDVIPVPVCIDEEIEKWTIFGQPVVEAWLQLRRRPSDHRDGTNKEHFNWGRKNSVILFDAAHGVLWCRDVSSLERHLMIATDLGASRGIHRVKPDVMIISGYLTRKYLPVFKNLWEQMA